YFETTVRSGATPKLAATWIIGELSAAFNRDQIDVSASRVSPEQLASLLKRVQDGTISGKIAKDIFEEMWRSVTVHVTGVEARALVGTVTVEVKEQAQAVETVDAIIERKGLRQISDEAAIERIVDDVLAASAAIIAEVKAGKEKAFNSLVGQVMKASKGKANPAQVNAILKRRLGAR
ncbi:MAG TPA: hypothetical protein VEO36_06495, partial [Casimicrobiaceae bacterium]|nr:hypothetical protein [Casimicrobiaceae bacterium]